MGDPFAEGSRRLSHHFAVVNLIHSRLTPTQPFSERSPTSFSIDINLYCKRLMETYK
ncbi:MAG: hypothetical protein LBK82_00510 [Planctomycetaceae bacterium]|nr:hypothetical protein [Planctomycetaceae bacterium]